MKQLNNRNTVFFGSSSYVLPIIEILNKNYELTLVITTEQKSTDAVPKYCAEHNIPFISVKTLNDPTLRSKRLALSCLFAVLADFKLLVPRSVLDLFPKGILNIHPSLLPDYRGPTPGTSAILDGKEKTGVSIMLLDKQLDHGPILQQESEAILPTDTSATLYPRLFAKGAELLEKVLPEYLDGKVKPTQQDHSKATYTDYLTRESGHIDLNSVVISRNKVTRDLHEISHPDLIGVRNDKIISPQQLDRMVRAYHPWPGVWTVLRVKGKGLRVKLVPNLNVIARSKATKQSYANKNTYKEIAALPTVARNDKADSLLFQVEGKKPVSVKDFLNGYPKEGKELLQKLGLLPQV